MNYIIGIDLGTTNTALAWTDASVKPGIHNQINIFNIPQLTGQGTVEKQSILPSFLFLPEKHDVATHGLDLPWDPDNTTAIGTFAKKRGAEIPARLVSSAKSWLCHTLIDRTKPVLPWAGPESVSKISPVDASAAILKHIRDAWNHEMAHNDEADKLENQDIYLTIPASFDAVARELTVQAAEKAGLRNVTLLEEPQAAFYSWIEAAGDKWRDAVQPGDRVLVCDVGGGTTDFSLIAVRDKDGDMELDRIAVGNHLLVGGDNIDLALAWFVRQKLGKKGKKLNASQMAGLIQTCREAKEKLLADDTTEQCPITILGTGSFLIGGTIKTDLLKSEVIDIVINGFLPECDLETIPEKGRKTGIRELGLSYESDPAITKHLAQFVAANQQTDETDSGQAQLPNVILFNGGIMKAGEVRKRIKDTVSQWTATPAAIRELASDNFDLSVARGAAAYGLARNGAGIRIRSGLARSYYVSIESSMPAIPGMPAPIKALCVAPFGMEEGDEALIEDQAFVIVTGEDVVFDLMASTIRHDDVTGTIVEDWDDDEITDVTTLETTLEGEYGTAIPVSIRIKVTETGTLEFWCVSKENSEQRWKLAFNVRERDDFES